ncbi:hypothetical protein J6590_108131, partial [Homalodisca vitripennis]
DVVPTNKTCGGARSAPLPPHHKSPGPGVDSGSAVPAWDPLSDSRDSFDEGLTKDRRTHTAALEW